MVDDAGANDGEIARPPCPGVDGISRSASRRERRQVWRAQIAVIVGHTLMISVRLPQLRLRPYEPLVKNLPLLAAPWLAATLERSRAS